MVENLILKSIDQHFFKEFEAITDKYSPTNFCLVVATNHLSPYPAQLIFLNFQPLEVVSRYRDQQLQVAENTHICLI